MLEIVATTIITVSSVLLFGYWYRYTCLLILSAKTTKDYSGEVARANKLSFAEVRGQLPSAVPGDLDRLQRSLDRDYARLHVLIEAMSNRPVQLEDRMLQLNYELMSAFYRVSRRFSANCAQGALEEMSLVIEHFANALGERTATASA